MLFIRYFNDKVRKLNIFDVKLIQGTGIAVALILVKLVPDILSISIWWFVALLIICAIRPSYIFFFKR
jgi:hypothetical protein